MILALDWADANDAALAALIRARAAYYYGSDRDCPGWEPGGDDFLSSALAEALADAARAAGRRVPRLVRRLPARPRGGRAAQPVRAGLRLGPIGRQDRPSRRRQPQPRLVLARHRRRARSGRWPSSLARTADAHLDASLPHVAGDYMGEHWLATFALLALSAEPYIQRPIAEFAGLDRSVKLNRLPCRHIRAGCRGW